MFVLRNTRKNIYLYFFPPPPRNKYFYFDMFFFIVGIRNFEFTRRYLLETYFIRTIFGFSKRFAKNCVRTRKGFYGRKSFRSELHIWITRSQRLHYGGVGEGKEVVMSCLRGGGAYMQGCIQGGASRFVPSGNFWECNYHKMLMYIYMYMYFFLLIRNFGTFLPPKFGGTSEKQK